MTQGPRFQVGDTVVLRTTREMGRVEREPVRDGGEYWYRVRFVKVVENIPEGDLDPLDELYDSLESLARCARWGMLRAFRTALAVERIVHTNRSTIYSFRAQRILFQPYQYKPLLKILDSPDRRLLIADEVGLGKTIEAGLILTELEARRPLQRVLVVCPSRLRDKWREEMNRKFEQDFALYDRRRLVEFVERERAAARPAKLTGVCSMQTLRNSELRELLLGELGSIDLVIVDEAHHARNPTTKTSAMLRDVCELGDCVVLLTATPIHLGSQDLFTLLQALRPGEFRDAAVFDAQLKRFAGVHQVCQLIRSKKVNELTNARKLLEQMFVDSVTPKNRDPLAMQVIDELAQEVPDDRRAWIELERRVQDLHPLASVVTRTRKRDVQEKAPVRRAHVHRCNWTNEEDQLYQTLVHGATPLGWLSTRLSIGQIQRARQAASCLPAALIAKESEVAKSDD